MEAGKTQEVATILKRYKTKLGAVDFPILFEIPAKDRIAALAEQNFSRMNGLIIVALTTAFENLNVKRGMNEIQILNLSEAIIDSAAEDNLSFEDLLLFLQQFVRGKFPMSYESLDLPKFMKALDMYREERWHEGIKLRDSRIAQWQGLGDSGRSTKTDSLSEHMSGLSGRIADMKDAMRERKIGDTMKNADKYFDDK